MFQPVEDRVGRQQPDPRRGQLDRERQAIQPADDLGDRGGVPLINGEAGHHGGGPLGEQPYRLAGGERRERGGRPLRQGERRDRAFLLARHAKGRPAAHQDTQITGVAQQFRHHRGRRQQVLEVVQDDQELAISQVISEMLDQRPASGVRQPDALGDRRKNQPGVCDRRQPDEIDPIRIFACQPRGEFDAKTRLAAATGAGQREQAAGLQQAPCLCQLPLPADETRQRPGHAAGTVGQDPARGRAQDGVSGRGVRHWRSAPWRSPGPTIGCCLDPHAQHIQPPSERDGIVGW